MYQALYRQFRPMDFESLVGQDHIIETLKNQIKNGNIGHAYLFSGTRGTGKTSTAKIFSRAVNCLEPIDSSPCNKCEICRGILDGSIMDVIEMDAASNRGVDDIKNLRDKVNYPPSYGRYKVYIIDEVHMLTKEAFNSLLKTLEEPPRHIIFILATTEPERIPETILSRCQRFDFKRIDRQTMIENMRMISREHGLEIQDEALDLIARNADGGMRDALSILDQCLSFSQGELGYEDVIAILGITNHDLIFQMVDDILRQDIESILLSIDQLMADGRNVNQFIKDIIRHFRDLMIVKSFKDADRLVEASQELIASYKEQAKTIEMDFILRSLDILTQVDERSKLATDPRIILEMAMIKMVQGENLSLEERLARLEAAGPITRPEPAARAKAPRSQAPKAKSEPVREEKKIEAPLSPRTGPSPELERLRKDWPQLIEAIKRDRPNIAALLVEGQLVGLENDMLIVEYQEIFGFHKNAISNPRNSGYLKEFFSQHYNRELELRFDMAREEEPPLEDKKKDNEELVTRLRNIFGENLEIEE